MSYVRRLKVGTHEGTSLKSLQEGTGSRASPMNISHKAF